METLQQSFNQLELQLLSVIENQYKLKEENAKLRNQISIAEETTEQTSLQVYQLEQENKKLKVVSAFSGNEEYKKLMKLQLNKLIKEIDLCIAQVKSN